VGYEALVNSTGQRNTGFGYKGGSQITSGAYNTFVGSQSGGGANLITGEDNIGLGSWHDSVIEAPLGSLSTGNRNIGIGNGAIRSQTTASYNTAVGYAAGADGSGSTNAYFGYEAGRSMGSGSKNTIIGSYGGNEDSLDIRSASNRVVTSDGDGNITTYHDSEKLWVAGPVGAGVDNGTALGAKAWSGFASFSTTANATQTFEFDANTGSSYILEILISGYASAGSGSFVRQIVDGGHPGGAIYHHVIQTANSVAGYTLGTTTETAGGFTFTVASPAYGGTIMVMYKYADSNSNLPVITFS
jgi:hypothetical protein